MACILNTQFYKYRKLYRKLSRKQATDHHDYHIKNLMTLQFMIHTSDLVVLVTKGENDVSDNWCNKYLDHHYFIAMHLFLY